MIDFVNSLLLFVLSFHSYLDVVYKILLLEVPAPSGKECPPIVTITDNFAAPSKI